MGLIGGTLRKSIEQKVVDRGCEILLVEEDVYHIKCKCGITFTKTRKQLKDLRSNVQDKGTHLSCEECGPRWTNKKVQTLLDDMGNQFECLDDISLIKRPSTTRVRWGCRIDGHIWMASVDQITQSRSGCPK